MKFPSAPLDRLSPVDRTVLADLKKVQNLFMGHTIVGRKAARMLLSRMDRQDYQFHTDEQLAALINLAKGTGPLESEDPLALEETEAGKLLGYIMSRGTVPRVKIMRGLQMKAADLDRIAGKLVAEGKLRIYDAPQKTLYLYEAVRENPNPADEIPW